MANTDNPPEDDAKAQNPPPRHPKLDERPLAVDREPSWTIFVGAGFGFITLIGFFVFSILAGLYKSDFVCNAYIPMSVAFGLGFGLSAAFLGGKAVAEGNFGDRAAQNSFAYGLGGGVAVVIIGFVIFNFYRPTNCTTLSMDFFDVLDPTGLKLENGKRSFTHLSQLSATTPIEVNDVATFRVPLLGVISGFSPYHGQITINADAEVWDLNNNKLLNVDNIPVLFGKDAWERRNLIINSGGKDVFIRETRESKITIMETQIPILFLLGCWQNMHISSGNHEFKVILTATDGHTRDNLSAKFSLHLPETAALDCPSPT